MCPAYSISIFIPLHLLPSRSVVWPLQKLSCLSGGSPIFPRTLKRQPHYSSTRQKTKYFRLRRRHSNFRSLDLAKTSFFSNCINVHVTYEYYSVAVCTITDGARVCHMFVTCAICSSVCTLVTIASFLISYCYIFTQDCFVILM